MASADLGDPGGEGIGPTSSPVPEELRREFEELGLSPYEARALLALLRLGTANSAQVADMSGVPRTSLYQVFESLSDRGLAARVSQDGPATWQSPGTDAVMDRLVANAQEQLRRQETRAASLREVLKRTIPDSPSVAQSFVHIVPGKVRHKVREIYDGLLRGAQTEVLVFNRPPYAFASNHVYLTPDDTRGRDEVNPIVLETLARGVQIRVLYQRQQWDDPAAADFRQAMGTYHQAGVVGRVAETLPIKLAIADRTAVLLTMSSPELPEVGFPSSLFIDHPGFAAVQADAFDHRWASSKPVATSRKRR